MIILRNLACCRCVLAMWLGCGLAFAGIHKGVRRWCKGEGGGTSLFTASLLVSIRVDCVVSLTVDFSREPRSF